MQRHADIWKHVNAQTAETLRSHIDTMDHVLPALGTLTGDPDVTAKDVIKAVANAAAEGKMSPSAAVAAISDMPADPDKLRPWLRDRYAQALTTTVHAKAALARQAQAAAQPAPAAPVAAPLPAPVPQPGAPA
jgi:hypothetical protein